MYYSTTVNHTEMLVTRKGPTLEPIFPILLKFIPLTTFSWKHQEVPKWSLWASNMPPMYGRRAFHQCCRTGCLINSLRWTQLVVRTHTHPKNHRTSTWTTWKKDMFFWKIINFRWNIATVVFRSIYVSIASSAAFWLSGSARCGVFLFLDHFSTSLSGVWCFLEQHLWAADVEQLLLWERRRHFVIFIINKNMSNKWWSWTPPRKFVWGNFLG